MVFRFGGYPFLINAAEILLVISFYTMIFNFFLESTTKCGLLFISKFMAHNNQSIIGTNFIMNFIRSFVISNPREKNRNFNRV
jgi:hypothetical protein